jgi:UDP-GlcNAc3NAcA epimerase
LAGAIAASKIHIPIAHIEAGLRSYNKSMPEEVNRILCDHVSTLLFSPTPTGFNNLVKEGFKKNEAPFTADHPGIFQCGDLMYDNSLYFADIADNQTDISGRLHLDASPFILATIHRNNNTDDATRINQLFTSLAKISIENKIRVILPVHPRTQKMMDLLLNETNKGYVNNNTIEIIPPASFFEMIVLEKKSMMVITDSGGVQKEAYFFKKPCIILRPETEWVELVENGAAKICDADGEKINDAFNYYNKNKEIITYPSVFGDGKAANFILETLWNNRIN